MIGVEGKLLSSKPLASFRIMLLMKNFDWISEGGAICPWKMTISQVVSVSS